MAQGDTMKMIEKGAETSIEALPFRIEAFLKEMSDNAPDLLFSWRVHCAITMGNMSNEY